VTVASALKAWVVAGSALAADRVRVSNRTAAAGQGAPPRPSGTGAWISMLAIVDDQTEGQDWTTRAVAPLTLPGGAWVADATTNTLTLAAHGLLTGDGPVRLATTGTLPGGLALLTSYWIIRTAANTVQLAATFLGAIETPTPIDLSSAGSGSHTLVAVAADGLGSLGTVRAGQEITITTAGPRWGSLSIQCYGGADPAAVLKRLKASLALPSVLAALRAGGVGIGTMGPVRPIGGELQPGFLEPRAVVDVRFHYSALPLSETGSVIETAVATGTVT